MNIKTVLCGTALAGSVATVRRVIVAASIVFGTVSCGGSGGGAGGVAVGVPNAGPAVGAGTVVLAVTDALGQPASGVEVSLSSSNYSKKVRTAADGAVTLAGVPPGNIWAFSEGIGAYGGSRGGKGGVLVESGRLELSLELTPASHQPAFGLLPAEVAPDAVAPDGRSMEFTLRVVFLLPDSWDYDSPPTRVLLTACTPDAQNDTPVHRADCIEGAAGYDAPYSVVGAVDPGVTDSPGGTPVPFSAALLMDQSRNIIVSDPADVRVFAAKYFLRKLGPDNRAALAAFAANSVSGEARLLPSQPVTLYPVGAFAFRTTNDDLFPAIDALPTLEGGAAPLYAAIDAMLDVVSASASATGRKAIVVVTAGVDDTCGSADACHSKVVAVIAKSRAANVAIVSLGIANANQAELTQLAQSTGGAAMWTEDPEQLGLLLGGVPAILDGSVSVSAAKFRIVSPIDGAFASGRTVLGTTTLQVCEWTRHCYDYPVEFAIRIP